MGYLRKGQPAKGQPAQGPPEQGPPEPSGKRAKTTGEKLPAQGPPEPTGKRSMETQTPEEMEDRSWNTKRYFDAIHLAMAIVTLRERAKPGERGSSSSGGPPAQGLPEPPYPGNW